MTEENNNKSQNFKEALGNAWQGCCYAFKTQKNFVFHFIISVLVILLALWLDIPFERFLFLMIVIFFCLTVELGNTAVEKTVDLVTERWNHKAKIAKDLSAGMMLLASLGSIIVGILILLPPLIEKINSLL